MSEDSVKMKLAEEFEKELKVSSAKSRALSPLAHA
jgi:hypothetical protein